MNYLGAGAGAFMIFYFIFMLAMAGLSIYCLVLFIKLARRGIVALDNYNSKSSRELKTNYVTANEQGETTEYN